MIEAMKEDGQMDSVKTGNAPLPSVTELLGALDRAGVKYEIQSIDSEGSVQARTLLTVSGQLGPGTGGIDFAGSLVVHGDILGEIALRVKGSLTVRGNVEDADIQAGEDVTVAEGFVGRGKGRIAAGGNVTLHHLRNQTVSAGKDVLVELEAVNGNVNAAGRIYAPGAVIVGGVLRSDGDIVVRAIGSSDALQTKVWAGKRGRILERLPLIEREIKQAESRVGDINNAIYGLVRLQMDARNLDAAQQESLQKLQAVQKQLPERIAALKAEHHALQEDLKVNKEVTVTVRETVFENTMVDINGSKKIVNAALRGVIFRERNGAIEAVSC